MNDIRRLITLGNKRFKLRESIEILIEPAAGGTTAARPLDPAIRYTGEGGSDEAAVSALQTRLAAAYGFYADKLEEGTALTIEEQQEYGSLGRYICRKNGTPKKGSDEEE